MLIQFLFAVIFSLILTGCGQSSKLDLVVESNSIADVFKYIEPNEYNKDTLVIFDIDNTLLAPKTDLGSDQWFYALFNERLAAGLSTEEAIASIMPLYTGVLNNVHFYAIEPNTVQVIDELQNKGIAVIALTARSFDLAHRTVEQLHAEKIFFTKTDPHECPIVNDQGRKQKGLYIDGIIFSGSYSKGEMIESWLHETHYKPKKIIFVDDKIKNVKSVQEPLVKHGYPFIGIRYGYVDQRVKDFDFDKTQKELMQLFESNPEIRPIPSI